MTATSAGTTNPATCQPAPPSRRGRRRRGWAAFAVFADLAALAAVTAAVSWRSGAFRGMPMGYDALGHLAKINLLRETFPQVTWNYAWYSGVPYFEGSYPPGYHSLVAGVARFTGVSDPTAMNAVSAAALVAIVLATYELVRVVGGSRVGGLVAALLVLSTPALWSQVLEVGLLPRLVAFALLASALACSARWVIRPTHPRLVAAASCLAGSLLAHPVVGVGGTVGICALLALAPADWTDQRVVRPIKVVTPAVGLAGFFYVPLLLVPLPQSPFTSSAASVPWQRLIGVPSANELTVLPAVLLPMCVALTVIALIARRLWRRKLSPELAAVVHRTSSYEMPGETAWPMQFAGVCGLGALAVFGYGLIGHVTTFDHYVNGLQPLDLLVYAAWLLATGCGLVLGIAAWETLPFARILRAAAALSAASAVVAGVVLIQDPGRHRPNDTSSLSFRALAATLPGTSDERDYRIGASEDAVTKWLNLYSETPQIRGYQQASRTLDWQVWLEESLGNKPATIDRKFLLDWYAVKWVYSPPSSAESFDTDREYEELASLPGWSTYRYRPAGRIHAARSTPAVLVIGTDVNYDLVLRALAPSRTDSRLLIPIHGGEAIDNFSAAELSRFDAVLLYGATARSVPKATALLREYVRAGGGLLVESADDPELLAALGRQPDSPLPAAGFSKWPIGDAWLFDIKRVGARLLTSRELQAFSAPVYMGASGPGPWEVTIPRRVASWAQVAVTAQGVPVMLTGRYGSGRVAWVGLNLPYHTSIFRNQAESQVLADLVRGVLRTRTASTPVFMARWDSAERRTVTLTSGATGVLVKESHSPGWRATVNGRVTKVWRAGPDMMWVWVPPGKPATVVLTHHLTAPERAGVALSLTSLLLLMAVGCRLAWRSLRTAAGGRRGAAGDATRS